MSWEKGRPIEEAYQGSSADAFLRRNSAVAVSARGPPLGVAAVVADDSGALLQGAHVRATALVLEFIQKQTSCKFD